MSNLGIYIYILSIMETKLRFSGRMQSVMEYISSMDRETGLSVWSYNVLSCYTFGLNDFYFQLLFCSFFLKKIQFQY